MCVVREVCLWAVCCACHMHSLCSCRCTRACCVLHVLQAVHVACVMYARGHFLYMCAFCAHEAVLCICVDVRGSGYAVCVVCVLCVCETEREKENKPQSRILKFLRVLFLMQQPS